MARTAETVFEARAMDLVGQANDESLNWMMRLMKERWAYLDEAATSSFSVGELVKFATKNLGTVYGSVTKVNRKTVRVRTQSGTSWKVSSHILEHSDGPE